MHGFRFDSGVTAVNVLPANGGARLAIGAAGIVDSSASNNSIQAPVELGADQSWRIDGGILSVASLDLKGYKLILTGAGQLAIGALAGGATSQLTVNTSGQVEIGNSGLIVLNSASAIELAGGSLTLPSNRFWVRRTAPTTAAAKVQFNFEKASGAFDKSVQFPITLNDGAWHLETVKFKSIAAYTAGAALVSVWVGYGVQTVEIGALEVLNYQSATPP